MAQNITIPMKTGLPHTVEVDIANTVDFHIASSNYYSVVDNYANHLAAYYHYSHLDSTVDPITRKAKFFEEINNSDFNAIVKGGTNITSEFIEGNVSRSYNLTKLDTLLEPNEIWILGDDRLPESKTEGGSTYYHSLNLLTQTNRWLQFDEKTASLINEKLFSNISDAWGVGDITHKEFLLHWYNQYRLAHNKVKEKYEDMVDDKSRATDEISRGSAGNYFTTLSENIGELARLTESVDDKTIPFLDTDLNLFNITPSLVCSSIDDKLDDETKTIFLDFSLKTNRLFRKHLRQMNRFMAPSNSSHGEDLMQDYMYWVRMTGLYEGLNGIIAENLGNAYSVLSFMRTAKDEQKIKSPQIELVIENNIVKVDFLMNRIEELTKKVTNDDRLKAKSINVTDSS